MAKETNTNCEIIVDRVLDQITSGALKKGDKLPTERQLSESMNVSRASVREAIKSLESMGIAESIQGSGSYITDSPEKTINRPLCAPETVKKEHFDSLKTPSFLQNRIFAKNVASLPKALRSKTLAAIYPIRGGAPPALELPPQNLWRPLLVEFFDTPAGGTEPCKI
jgi:GntR family transcriptional repressor for pyruvate dehydrogenase complex